MKRFDWKATLRRIGKAARNFLSRDLGLKLLSVVFALFLWSFVITANPNITRMKTVTGIEASVSGQATLTYRGLALLTDVSGQLSDVTVRVNAPQASYSLVSDSNVRVELDLTSIRTTGKQRVNLTGRTVYGEIVQIWPEYIDLEVETLDQRYIPVNVQLVNADTSAYWYSLKANPMQVTISGPTSIVQTVSSASVTVDATDVTSSQSRAEQFALLTAQGEEVTATLTRSTSSITVNMDVYPSKVVPIASDPEDILSGEVPMGYEITSVVVTPDTAVIAAEQSLLDSINELTFSKIDVSNRTASFTRTLNLSSLNGLKYMSTDQTTVNVTISEIETTRRFQDVAVSLVNKPDALNATTDISTVSVVVTGPYSQVQALHSSDIIATVELTGLEKGEYELPIYVTVDNLPGLFCTATPSTAGVTLK